MVAKVITRADEETFRLSSDVRVGQMLDLPLLRGVEVPLIDQRVPAGGYVLRVAPFWPDVISSYDDPGNAWPFYQLAVSVGVGGVNVQTREPIVGALSAEQTRVLMLPASGIAIPVRGSHVRVTVLEDTATTKLACRVQASLSPGELGTSYRVWSQSGMVAPLERDVDAVPGFATHLEVTARTGMLTCGFRRVGAGADSLGALVMPGETARIPVDRQCVCGVVQGADPMATSQYSVAWVVQS